MSNSISTVYSALTKLYDLTKPSPSTSTPTTSTSTSSTSGVECRPWSKEDYGERVRSYRASTWFGKPEILSPLVCARFGYVNVDVDTITCQACRVPLVFKLDYPTQSQVMQSAEQFYESLNKSHRELCPWLNNACSPSFSDFPLHATDTEIKSDICERLNSFEHAITTDWNVTIPQWVISLIERTEFQQVVASVPHKTPTSIFLTLCGWESIVKSNGSRVLHCRQCQRTTDMKRTKQQHHDTETSATKKRLFDLVSSSNIETTVTPLQYHRWFCPWLKLDPDTIQRLLLHGPDIAAKVDTDPLSIVFQLFSSSSGQTSNTFNKKQKQ